MLMLSRRRFESIMIGNDVEIKIHEIANGKVRLAINAPKEVPVHRKEVWESLRTSVYEPENGEGDDGCTVREWPDDADAVQETG